MQRRNAHRRRVGGYQRCRRQDGQPAAWEALRPCGHARGDAGALREAEHPVKAALLFPSLLDERKRGFEVTARVAPRTQIRGVARLERQLNIAVEEYQLREADGTELGEEPRDAVTKY